MPGQGYGPHRDNVRRASRAAGGSPPRRSCYTIAVARRPSQCEGCGSAVNTGDLLTPVASWNTDGAAVLWVHADAACVSPCLAALGFSDLTIEQALTRLTARLARWNGTRG